MVSEAECLRDAACFRPVRSGQDIYTAMKEVMMANERVGEEDAEAILASLKMEGRYTVEAWS